jgi:hypothetical protein
MEQSESLPRQDQRKARGSADTACKTALTLSKECNGTDRNLEWKDEGAKVVRSWQGWRTLWTLVGTETRRDLYASHYEVDVQLAESFHCRICAPVPKIYKLNGDLSKHVRRYHLHQHIVTGSRYAIITAIQQLDISSLLPVYRIPGNLCRCHSTERWLQIPYA